MSSANVSQVNKKSSLVNHVVWSPDDSKILACFRDHSPQLICARTQKVLRELVVTAIDGPRPGASQAHFDEIGFLAAFSPDGTLVALGKDRLLQIFEAATGKIIATHSVKVNPATAQQFLDSLNTDAVLSRLPPIGSREQQVQRLNKYIKEVPQGLTTLRWDKFGIAVGTPVGAYQINLVDGNRRVSLRPITCPGMVRSPVISPDGEKIAALFVPNIDVMADLYWNFNKALNIGRRGLCVWNIETGAVEVKFQGDDLPEWQQCTISWSADSQMLAWGYDNKVIVFDVYTQVARVLARSQDDETRFMAWNPRKNHLAVQDGSDGIVIYDSSTGTRRANYKDSLWGRYKDIGGRVFAWSNTGDALVIGGHQNALEWWKP
ncbi:MAG: WD40 repeat domain-containing protein [Candidatus Melainabacteria bacterium]|nr:WD40 repeat domain-containing protein [Candidatus Melainabacteria bacterium]